MKPITGRNISFTRTLAILEKTFSRPITIVETGCIRNTTEESKLGDGWSTVNWEHYARHTNSKVYVVDISEHHLSKAKQIVPESEYVTYTHQDSIEYLQNFDKQIDFLFLDSYDYCGPEENIIKCHNHSLNEVLAAWDKLNPACFILIDDVFDDAWNGKGKLSIPYILDNGFTKIYREDSQALFYRGSL